MWTKRWDMSSGWSSYKLIGGSTSSNAAMAALGTARIDAFYIDSDFSGAVRLWHRRHQNGRLRGDFDGDGKADLALYRYSTNTWHIAPTSGASAYSATLGSRPTPPDDFDNDGRTDMTVTDVNNDR